MRGVEVGRVISIRAADSGAVATLELYRQTRLPKDSRFVNFNYSLFGARMVWGALDGLDIIGAGTHPSPPANNLSIRA